LENPIKSHIFVKINKNMKNALWKLLGLLDSNWGYITPLQKRFGKGDVCKVSNFRTDEKLIVGEEVTIVENGRYDYLISNKSGEQFVVYQFELFSN